MIQRRSRRGHSDVTHIDMVPMVDCIMVLVIFLMISSAFVREPGVDVDKPDVRGTINTDQSILFLAITRDNRIYFDGQEIRPDQVAGVLKQAAIGRAPAVVIRGDRSSNLGMFATVYTEAKRSGIARVQFATAQAEQP